MRICSYGRHQRCLPTSLLISLILALVGCSSDDDSQKRAERPRVRFIDPSDESDDSTRSSNTSSTTSSHSVGGYGNPEEIGFTGGGYAPIAQGVSVPTLSGQEKQAYIKTLSELEQDKILRKAPDTFQGLLPLTFVSTADCVVGDIDIISGHMAKSGAARLLLTLEDLHPQGRKAPYYTVQIMPEQLKQGFSVNVPVMATRIPLHLGLFVCGDGGQGESCKGKMVTNMPAMSVVYRPVNPYQPKVTFYPDTVFVFHYLSYDAQSIRALARIAKPEDMTVIGYAVSLLEEDDEGLEEVLTLANGYTNSTKSLPIKFEGGRYLIDLPHFDMDKCPKDAVPPVR